MARGRLRAPPKQRLAAAVDNLLHPQYSNKESADQLAVKIGLRFPPPRRRLQSHSVYFSIVQKNYLVYETAVRAFGNSSVS